MESAANELKKLAITVLVGVALFGAIGGVTGGVAPSIVEDILQKPFYYKNLVLPGIFVGAAIGLLCSLLASVGLIWRLLVTQQAARRAIPWAGIVCTVLLAVSSVLPWEVQHWQFSGRDETGNMHVSTEISITRGYKTFAAPLLILGAIYVVLAVFRKRLALIPSGLAAGYGLLLLVSPLIDRKFAGKLEVWLYIGATFSILAFAMSFPILWKRRPSIRPPSETNEAPPSPATGNPPNV
ncbi:MAG: hypothetical protein WCN95_10270 [bacterium]